jgi:anaerobic selenocysteine-containing dehydrogenase
MPVAEDANLETHYRTCPFCEATCGLDLKVQGDRVISVRGDAEDVFSHGFLCPKSQGVKLLREDPDRLRTPLIRQPDGSFREAGYDEAFRVIAERLPPILEAHGRDACAVYLGNPNAHNLDSMIYGRVLLKALRSKNLYSATSVDQLPKHVSAGLMFGHPLSIPVPDVDRCIHLLILGANPLVSNGSLMTAPDMRGRLRRIRERGGKIVVVDPKRTRTAEAADEHHFIRPGTDALLLFALVHVLFEEDLVDPGPVGEHLSGLDEIEALAQDFSPESVAPVCGIAAPDIRRMARELADADAAACYGRIGTTTQEFGALASWLVDVVNALAGCLDREGGAMFPLAAAGQRNSAGAPGSGRGWTMERWASRVRGLPEAIGELPVACLAEEIDTPGDGQVRALITIAGNPAVSTPNAARLDRALTELDFMVSVDIYLNETTRHAHVILPAGDPLERGHYDLALYQLGIRSVANYSPPVFETPNGQPGEWQLLLRLAGVVAGQGPDVDVETLDDMTIATLVQMELGSGGSSLAGRNQEEILSALEPRRGPERVLDFMLRSGHFGDHFNGNPDGLTLAKLEANPHGIDLGPPVPRLPDVLRTPSGKIELAPEQLVRDVPRLKAALTGTNGHMVLIGRRQLRSNNSWMHNLEPLVKGKDGCTLQVHPDDAARLGLIDGGQARARSRTGDVVAPVEVTDAIMPGVVSIPHGWGHDVEGTRQQVAADHAGVNSNLLADETLVDELSGNAVLNGIPVELSSA